MLRGNLKSSADVRRFLKNYKPTAEEIAQAMLNAREVLNPGVLVFNALPEPRPRRRRQGEMLPD
jgi:hypothetical protein